MTDPELLELWRNRAAEWRKHAANSQDDSVRRLCEGHARHSENMVHLYSRSTQATA